MKKILISSIAILSLVACSKTDSPVKEQIFMTLGASIEQPTDATASTPTNISAPNVKATLNNSLSTLWSTGDKIRVYVSNNANDWHEDIDFYLYSGENTANGVFRNNNDYSGNNHWDYYAFFPYYYTAIGGETNTGSNMGGNGFYFYLPDSYYNYTSGQSFLPLLANMTGGSAEPTSVSFKHVGGAVVVSLTGVPGAAKSLGMTVSGKNIHGWPGKVVLSEVGTNSGKITASDGDNSTVWMNFATAAGNRDFKFIFPVPTISTTSNITFTMYDANNLKIWQKTASSQPAIGRAQALVMPERAVVAIPQNICLAGYWDSKDHDPEHEATVPFNNTTGKLTINVPDGGAHVFLIAADTGYWYRTQSYVNDADHATFKPGGSEKLFVPAGANRELTLTYQSDGNIQLSYK